MGLADCALYNILSKQLSAKFIGSNKSKLVKEKVNSVILSSNRDSKLLRQMERYFSE